MKPNNVSNTLYEGYVLYGRENMKSAPFGIISLDHKRKARLSQVPSKVQKYLIEVEDRRFYQHSGLDYKGIARAVITNIKHGKMLQGGSTITQQLARNLLEDNRKTISRKIKESAYALQLEKKYFKDCIIKMYFDNVFWGNNIYGLRAASLSYFGKEPYALLDQEYILLITLLRGPNLYLNNENCLSKRYELLNQILLKRSHLNQHRYVKNIKSKPAISYQGLESVKTNLIPYITSKIDDKNLKIETTIDISIQKSINQYVKESPYPISVVVFYKNKLCAIQSTYGHDYPINYKSNVGSTLKPFLYVFFRENGIDAEELFNSSENDFDNIGEGNIPTKSFYSLKEGLLNSNNNVFINAAQKVGLHRTYRFLSELLNKDISEISLATILGSSESGLSLYELGSLYSSFFSGSVNQHKKECFDILNENACSKWEIDTHYYLKTGTTNNNKECFSITGDLDFTLCVLRQNEEAKKYKASSLVESVKKYLNRNQKFYKWIRSKR